MTEKEGKDHETKQAAALEEVFDRIADTLLDALVAHADRRFVDAPPLPSPPEPSTRSSA